MENYGIPYSVKKKSALGYEANPAKINFGFKT
jgi:hypothetical protein